MIISHDALETQIPYYLTNEQKGELKKALESFSSGNTPSYYINQYAEDLLQGDGWFGLELITFEDTKKIQVKGVILSNSCDISADNKRHFSPKIVFAPIIKMSKYRELLVSSGVPLDSINSKLNSIKEQKISSIIYFPQGGALEEEYITVLDDICNMPIKTFEANSAGNKLFTLSMFGFYLFIFKLSVHFCRFREEIAR